MITNDVSDYINLLVRIAHIICNHPYYSMEFSDGLIQKDARTETITKCESEEALLRS
jgi:hypothetical protein